MLDYSPQYLRLPPPPKIAMAALPSPLSITDNLCAISPKTQQLHKHAYRHHYHLPPLIPFLPPPAGWIIVLWQSPSLYSFQSNLTAEPLIKYFPFGRKESFAMGTHKSITYSSNLPTYFLLLWWGRDWKFPVII